MKAKKIMALMLGAAMVFGLTACGSSDSTTTEDTAETTDTEVVEEVEEADDTSAAAPVEEEIGEVSIDFEDGSYSFVGVDKSVNSAGDDPTISVADFNGSKALRVEGTGKSVYVGIQMDALLGSDISNVASVSMTIGTENPEGTFYSAAGCVYGFLGEDNSKNYTEWSVYLEDANPKRVTYDFSGYSCVEGNYLVVSMETDTGHDKGLSPTVLYIDDIAFMDASGNVLSADTSAEFVAADTGNDRTNLGGIKDAVEFEGFSISGGGWAQDGLEMPEEIINALVPGSVVEITYSSTTGNIWLVMPWADAGWMRVGVGDADGSGQQYAYTNNSKTTAQITYEQIAAVCGDDVSTWGAMMQCESDGDWEVYSIKVGTLVPNYTVTNAVEFDGFNISGGGWAQDGLEMPEEIINALVPGSIVEITYSSNSGNIWLVMPWADAGWMRVGQGDADGSGSDSGISDGSKCYITYEQIAAVCGDDVSTWGAMMQCESDDDWEVYGIKVGTAAEMPMINSTVEFEGFNISGDGWAQDGLEMPQEVIDALVPGSVVEITYSSNSGNIWLVMPWADAGWMRVGQGNADGSGSDSAICDGSTCYVTYEQIAAVCGDDVSTWGAMMQCESDDAWEVYAVAIGQSK